MSGLLTLLALFLRTDGCAARDHNRHGGLALQRSQEVRGLLSLLAPFARADGCAVRIRIRHGGDAPLVRTVRPADAAGPFRIP